ncbi:MULTISPECIES: hypothetical protein [Enterobacteriaceae]|jgi:hypothetical protein|nr:MULTISPECIES: hypothetical protein [Enterobacteriaceae]MDU1655935.1 hypothetical protein [Leclercia adecarboxylata]MDU3897577.1 hypothetical protein [Enterobacter sp.]MDU4905386.1 hypothetical protein [Streptococcus lutetiensis]NQE22397.1 hypothetical protein [Klebsiella pneumoniae subsp. pneumoniae]MCR4216249.1 hypothetical protein [Enterobacter cloacae]
MSELYFWLYVLMELAKLADDLVPLFLSAAVLLALVIVYRKGNSK